MKRAEVPIFTSPVLAGLAGSLVAGLATGLGALPILVKREWSARAQRWMLAGAGGVMLGATFFSLLSPSLLLARAQTGSALGSVAVSGGSLMAGALLLWGLHELSPHEHFVKGREGPRIALAHNWLIVIAIALHNLPEGMSVGIAYAGDTRSGPPVMLGIGLHNVPEGLVVAAALAAAGTRPGRAFAIALGTGLVEPLGGLIGALVVSLSTALLPYALAGAAGAMLFVILGEILPETSCARHEHASTFAALLGFAAMMLLDVVLT